MATVTLYDAYVPYLAKSLASLDSILDRAEAHGKEHGLDVDAEYLGARLHDDMWHFAKQVSFVAETVPWFVNPVLARAGAASAPAAAEGGDQQPPRPEATSFADLRARLVEARECLQTLKPEHVNDLADEVLDL